MTRIDCRRASLIAIAAASLLLFGACSSDKSDDSAPASKAPAMAMVAPSAATPPAAAPAAPAAGATPVTKEQAEKTALATVPDGTVVRSELRPHHGKTVWHVYLRNEKGWDYDVNVDPDTGVVVPEN